MVPQADALDWAHVHQIPCVKILVGRRIEDASKSLRETLASRADGDRIEMLECALRSVLIEKRVTVVWCLSKDLEGLGHEFLNAADERSSVECHSIGLRQIYDVVRYAIDGEI